MITVSEHARARALLGGIALVVFAGRALWVARVGNDVPIWDQWLGEFAAVYEPLLTGQLGLENLIFLHNEHRILTTRLVSMVLFLLSGYWDVKGEMVASAALHALEMVLLFAALRPLVARHQFGLAVLLCAVGALPLSPFNLLSGFPMQFTIADVFAILALLQVASAKLNAEHVAACVISLLFAFLSMATGIVAAVAALAVVGLRALASRGLPRPLGAVAALLVCLAGVMLLFTPQLPGYGPPTPAESLRVLLRCVGFPTAGHPLWAMLSQLPLAILGFRLVRARALDDPWWRVVALGVWTLAVCAAVAVARGRFAAPAEQHFEVLALPLIWNWVALVTLIERAPPVSDPLSGRVRRALPAAAAGCVVLLLGGHVILRSLPTLRAIERAAPAVEESFRASFQTRDWRRQSVETVLVEQRMMLNDSSSLYDAYGRYAIPRLVLPRLAQADPRLARLLPPALTGSGRVALAARLLAGAAAAWPAALALGVCLLALGFATHPSTADEAASVAGS
jgi:hypothetical protein